MIHEDDLRDVGELNPADALNAMLACRDAAERMVAEAHAAEAAQRVFADNFRSRKMPDTVTQYLTPCRTAIEQVHATVQALSTVVDDALHRHRDLAMRRDDLIEAIQWMYSHEIPPLLDAWAATHGGVGYPDIHLVDAARQLEDRARDQVASFNAGVEQFETELAGSIRALRVDPVKYATAPLTPPAPPESPAKKRAKELAQWLVGQLGSNPNDAINLTDEQAATLTAYLKEFGGDAEAMAAFFGAVPPETLTNLLAGVSYTLGEGSTASRRSAAEELLKLIKKGFANGTASWDATKAEAFAKAAFSTASDVGLAALSQLFAGPPFPGAAISLAAAHQVQKLENVRPLVLPFPAGSSTPFDVTGAVFESLGQHPDEAYDFLKDFEDSDFDKLFRDRDWRDDGFTGITALLLGANRATGGLTSQPVEPVVQQRIAKLTSKGFDGLLKNPFLDADHLSPKGSVNLAGTIGLNLPGLTEVPIGRGPEGDLPADKSVSFGPFGEWFAPGVTVDDLTKLLGLASSRPAGAKVLRDAVSQYSDALLGLARSSSDALVVNNALTHLARLDGFVNGATAAGALTRATELDQKNAALADTVSSLFGLIPFPAASEALKLGDGLVKAAADAGQSALLSDLAQVGADGMKTDHAADELARSMRDRDAQENLSSLKIYGAVAQAFHIPGVEPQPRLDSDPTKAAAQVDDWLRTNRPAIDAWLKSNSGLSAGWISGDWVTAYALGHDRGRP